MSAQNYEELYNNLKEEFEINKKDNDEICKEYESTIQMLSESAESFKKQKEELELKIKSFENEQKSMKKEKESLMNKNKDKIIDIQNLNKQNDRLTIELKRLKEEKALFDSKIVSLENDNEHYQNKIRENEAVIEDLENQLESALEENITLQTEFEIYKQTTGDQLIRKDEEIRDIRNDNINKEKMIQRLSKKASNTLLKNIQKNIKEDKDYGPPRRRFTLIPGYKGIDLSKLRRTSFLQNFENSTENLTNDDKNDNKNNNGDNNNVKNNDSYNSLNSLKKLNNAKKSLYRKGTMDPNTLGEKLKALKEKENKYAYPKSNRKASNATDKKTEIEEISEVSEGNKVFTDLKVCDEKNMEILGSENLISNSGNKKSFSIIGKEKAIIEQLQSLLISVRKRKNRLLSHKKSGKEKHNKSGTKIRPS